MVIGGKKKKRKEFVGKSMGFWLSYEWLRNSDPDSVKKKNTNNLHPLFLLLITVAFYSCLLVLVLVVERRVNLYLVLVIVVHVE